MKNNNNNRRTFLKACGALIIASPVLLHSKIKRIIKQRYSYTTLKEYCKIKNMSYPPPKHSINFPIYYCDTHGYVDGGIGISAGTSDDMETYCMFCMKENMHSIKVKNHDELNSQPASKVHT